MDGKTDKLYNDLEKSGATYLASISDLIIDCSEMSKFKQRKIEGLTLSNTMPLNLLEDCFQSCKYIKSLTFKNSPHNLILMKILRKFNVENLTISKMKQ